MGNILYIKQLSKLLFYLIATLTLTRVRPTNSIAAALPPTIVRTRKRTE